MSVQDYAQHYLDEIKQLENKLQLIADGKCGLNEVEFVEFLRQEFEEFLVSVETF